MGLIDQNMANRLLSQDDKMKTELLAIAIMGIYLFAVVMLIRGLMQF